MKFPFRPGDILTKQRNRPGEPPLCDQIVSEWAVCMQIHLGIKTWRTSECFCVRVHARVSRASVCTKEYVYFERTQVHHRVWSQLLFQLIFTASMQASKDWKDVWADDQQSYTAQHLTASSQHYDSTTMFSSQKLKVRMLWVLDGELMLSRKILRLHLTSWQRKIP